MRWLRLAMLCVAGIMLASSNAAAQERGQVGLVMGYPTAIGAVWHATDRVGIKAEATFSVTSSELDAGAFAAARDLSTNSFSIAVAGLFYAGRTDNVSLYVSPRFSFGRIVSEIEDGEPNLRTEASTASFAGSFGAQYAPNRRFSAFGEVGLNYSTQGIESSPFSTNDADSSTFGLRSAVGIVLYFN